MKELCGSFTLSTGRNLQMNTPAGRLFGDTWFCVICQVASISHTMNHASISHDTDTIIAGELPHRLPGHTYCYNLNMSYHYPVAHSIMRVLALEHMN